MYWWRGADFDPIRPARHPLFNRLWCPGVGKFGCNGVRNQHSIKKSSENLNLTYKNEIAKRSCIGNNDHL